MAQLITGPSATSWGMVPGAEEYWVMTGFTTADVVDIMAHPVPFTLVIHSILEDEGLLQVLNVTSEIDPQGGRRIFFTVKNVGKVSMGYVVNTMILRG